MQTLTVHRADNSIILMLQWAHNIPARGHQLLSTSDYFPYVFIYNTFCVSVNVGALFFLFDNLIYYHFFSGSFQCWYTVMSLAIAPVFILWFYYVNLHYILSCSALYLAFANKLQ